MIFKLSLTISIVILLSFSQIKSQDIHFSQHYSNLPRLNPAFAGISRCSQISLSYRNQWTGISNVFNSYSATYQQYFNNIHSGIAINYLKNNEGNSAFSQNNFDAIYSFHFKSRKKTYVSLAFQISYLSNKISSINQIYSDMIDLQTGISGNSMENFINLKHNLIDFSTGTVFYNKKYYWGVAIHHLKKINISSLFYVLPTKYTAHLGARYKIDRNKNLKTDFEFSPNIIIVQQGENQEVNLGIYFYKDIFTLGMWTRFSIFPFAGNDALIFIFGTNFNRLKLGYSYDFTTSKLLKQSLGSHEISISYKFNCVKKINDKNTISCPSF